MEFVDFGRVSLINILPATAALLTNLSNTHTIVIEILYFIFS